MSSGLFTGTFAMRRPEVAGTTKKLGKKDHLISSAEPRPGWRTTEPLQTIRTQFEDPEFQIPGATLQEQLLNLVQAISALNHGQQQALYQNLK